MTMDFIGFTLIDLNLTWVRTKFSILACGRSKKPIGCYGLIQGVIKITPCGFGVRQLACIKAFIEAIGRWSGDVENAWYIEWY